MGIKKISLSFIKPRHLELIKLIKESWFTLFLATVCLLIVAGTTAVSAYLIKPALDDVFISKDARMLRFIPAAVIIVYFLRGLGYIRPGISYEPCRPEYHKTPAKPAVRSYTGSAAFVFS